MGSSRRKGSGRGAAAAAAARQKWKIGDLVLAKMKGFPAWPAMISEPEKWGFSSDRKKLLVYFYGTKQIAFCNHADIEAFTEEKKKSLLIKRQGKGADFVRAVEEIIEVYDIQKLQNIVGSISNNGGGDENASNQENLNEMRIHCSGMIVEHQPNLLSILHQPENAYVIECSDKIYEEGKPEILPDDENQNNNAENNDLIKNISILDQLRQIPMSSMPATRRRARDVISPSSVTKNISSHRRSRSSLMNNSGKSQKLAMQADAKLNAGCSNFNILTDNSTLNEKVIIRGEHLTACNVEASPVLIKALPEDILDAKTDGTNIDDGNVKEICGKIECSYNDASINTFLEEDCRQNNKFEIPANTRVIKMRRKPSRKLVTSSQASEQLEKGMIVPAEAGSLSDNSNIQNEKIDKFSNADGDEHLPLVKRARVRMGKPPSEESLNESVGSELNLGNFISSNGHYGSTTFSSPVRNGPPERTSPIAKEFSRSFANASYNNNTIRDLLPCKLAKLNRSLDVEAALPPSKRLHRALEAMSANAALEAMSAIDCPHEEAELKSTDYLGSSTENAFNSLQNSQPLHSSKTTAFDNSSCGLSSSLTFTKLVACQSTSEEVKPGDSNSVLMAMNSLQKHSDEGSLGRNCYHGTITSKIINTLRSSSPNQNDSFLIDKGHAYSKDVGASSKENNTFSSHIPAGLSPSISTPVTVCAATESDSFVPGSSELANVDSLGSYLNGMTSVLSSTTACSLSSDMNGALANDASMDTLSRSQLEQTSCVGDMQNVALGVKQTLKDKIILPKLAPIKDLIAAAQAKRFSSRSLTIYDSGDGKIVHDTVISPPLMNKEDSLGRASPLNHIFYHRPASDEGIYSSQNGSRTPLDGRKGGLSKHINHSEMSVARRSFESLLCSLSRTKESIGRATRLAIDCAKFGIAGEVIDMLLQHLEKESSLHKRVDLFFLVDSIAQCSRCQKGGPGDVYPSLVQAVLPRLLSAAAPPGIAASENRRQCHKVLRLWLERKTLPEFTVRHHIRELEYGSEPSLSISYSRRPLRTERPLNDPVREMEGMLVDEYGSNASFQLPQFLDTRIQEDDEGSTSDEKCFEAVTPDRNAEVDCGNTELTPKSIEKHRLVLEDVDGELEMEDVAPPCGHETDHVKGVEMTNNCNHTFEQGKNFSPFAPPLPDEQPPTPPPLPSSPPPDNTDFGTNYAPQNRILGLVGQVSTNLHCSSSLPEAAFYSQGFTGRLPPHMSHLVSQPSLSSGTKVYHLQPPPPVVSNQFSYMQTHLPRATAMNQSSLDNFHHLHDNRGNFYGDGAQRGVQIQVDVSDRGQIYPSSCAGPMGLAPEKVETPLKYPQHLDPSSPCQDWSYPPRTSSYLAPASGTLENPVSGASAAPAYWRAR